MNVMVQICKVGIFNLQVPAPVFTPSCSLRSRLPLASEIARADIVSVNCHVRLIEFKFHVLRDNQILKTQYNSYTKRFDARISPDQELSRTD